MEENVDIEAKTRAAVGKLSTSITISYNPLVENRLVWFNAIRGDHVNQMDWVNGRGFAGTKGMEENDVD